jgi:3',5'-cyclic AMP phosphodiesterase CpdA
LGPIPPIHPRLWNLKRATGFANWRHKRARVHRPEVADRLVADAWVQGADHVAISGDLINLGSPGEMALAATWLTTVGTADRVSVVPGNHDIYSTIGRDPGLARWAPYMAAADAADATFPYVRRFGRIALIGVNSAVMTPPLVASGRLGHAQLERLADHLRALGQAGMTRVVIIHHPPLPGQAKPSKALIDAEAFAAMLTACGADLVLHGHNHRTMHVRHPLAGGGTAAVIGVASASMAAPHPVDDLARYHAFRFRSDGAIVMVTRGLAGVGGEIVTLSEETIRPAP